MRLAYIFPGQGSQYAGMGRELADRFDQSREIFETADDALAFRLSQLMFEGPGEELQLTQNTQPAILTMSTAVLRAMSSAGVRPPDFVAGHSLGEYSALVAAGALSLSDAVRIVRARGGYMQEAVPVGVGAMAAVMGASLADVERCCREASGDEVCAPANINSSSQVVIAGNTAAVDRASELLKAAGAKRVVKLNVSAPFHCRLMMPAEERLATDLAACEFRDLATPLVTNVDAGLIREGAAARDALIRQVSAPVRWLESMELLIASGVDTFVEVGPGKVLTGLMRQISREVKCLNIEDVAGLETACAALG